MTTKKILLSTATFSLMSVAVAGVIFAPTLSANAQENTQPSNSANIDSGQGRFGRFTEEEREQFKSVRESVKAAIEEANYEAWKTAVTELPDGGERLLEAVRSETEFNQLVEAHNLAEQGNYEEAREIRENLGLDRGFGPRENKGNRPSKEQMEAVRTAIENKNYQEWQTAVKNSPNGGERILEAVDSEEDFNKLVEGHQKMQEGDREGAEEIREELGLPMRGKGPGGQGKQTQPQDEQTQE